MSRVKGNQAVFVGNGENQIGNIGRNSTRLMAKQKEKQAREKSTGNIFAGNLKGDISETIFQKKALARKEAAKVIADQVATDRLTTDAIEKSREHQVELLEEVKSANEELEYLNQTEEELKEFYGITDEYQPGSNEEYDQRMKELRDQKDYWNKSRDKALNEIGAESQSITARKQAQLKRKYTMEDAVEQSDEILDAASKEIIGLLRQEATDHVKEELEEQVEKAEEAAEKKKEEEEKLEAAREKRQEMEAEAEQVQEALKENNEVQEKIDEIKRAGALLDEDMKGIMVDVNIY